MQARSPALETAASAAHLEERGPRRAFLVTGSSGAIADIEQRLHEADIKRLDVLTQLDLLRVRIDYDVIVLALDENTVEQVIQNAERANRAGLACCVVSQLGYDALTQLEERGIRIAADVIAANAEPSEYRYRLRRAYQRSIERFDYVRWGNFVVMPAARSAIYHNEGTPTEIKLTPVQLRLLATFVADPHAILGYEQIYRQASLGERVNRPYLRVQMSYLRTALSFVGAHGYIKSVAGQGYVFAPVEASKTAVQLEGRAEDTGD